MLVLLVVVVIVVVVVVVVLIVVVAQFRSKGPIHRHIDTQTPIYEGMPIETWIER